MRDALMHDRFPQLRYTLPRLALIRAPTPVRELRALGEGVWVKDDSRTGELWGGNKPRKLEWTLADARRRGFGTVLTFGGTATNHGLATARYARSAGLRCVLGLVEQPFDEHVRAQLARLEASGATIYRAPTVRRMTLMTPAIMARHAQPRPLRPPYVLPTGGSSPVGVVGFVEAALELAEQVRAGELPEPAAVVSALGTGGTAAGLLVGLRLAGLRTRVVAVLVNDAIPLSEDTVLRLARRTLALLESRGAPVGAPALTRDDLLVVRGFLGRGYGHPTPEAEAAIELARADDLALDPVYTGKAVAALLGGGVPREDGPVLLWHTHSAVGHDVP